MSSVTKILQRATQLGVEVVFRPGVTVNLQPGDLPCSGFFTPPKRVYYPQPRLEIATGRSDWAIILLHEAQHMEQWFEQSPKWRNIQVDPEKDVWDFLPGWFNGEESISTAQAGQYIDAAQSLELDCERRVMRRLRELGYSSADLDSYAQSANAYLIYYHWAKKYRHWDHEIRPYDIEDLMKSVPLQLQDDEWYLHPPAELLEWISRAIKIPDNKYALDC